MDGGGVTEVEIRGRLGFSNDFNDNAVAIPKSNPAEIATAGNIFYGQAFVYPIRATILIGPSEKFIDSGVLFAELKEVDTGTDISFG